MEDQTMKTYNDKAVAEKIAASKNKKAGDNAEAQVTVVEVSGGYAIMTTAELEAHTAPKSETEATSETSQSAPVKSETKANPLNEVISFEHPGYVSKGYAYMPPVGGKTRWFKIGKGCEVVQLDPAEDGTKRIKVTTTRRALKTRKIADKLDVEVVSQAA